jgi:enterobacterial common antigen flippase
MTTSYKSIFKTSLLTGGSQVVTLFVQMIRAKILAVILGPVGTGIIGLYSATTGLVNTLANIGLSGSAVRSIAKDNISDDKTAIRKTLFVYRTLVFGTSLIAAAVTLIFAGPIAKATFGDETRINGIRWMSLVVLFTGVSIGQYSLLQGLRRIKELAVSKVLGVISGTIVCILLIYFFRERGIVPYLIAGAASAVLFSWYFAGRTGIHSRVVSIKEFRIIASGLLGMGMAFLASGLVTSFSGYYSRVLITDRLSVTDLGLYTASWTLSAVYVNFVLSAMGTDFYPRLSSVINDHEKANLLINEQTIMGITLSLAGVVTVIGFAKYILNLFYSAEFVPAMNILQWMTAGMALKIISWPIGFILVSKGKAILYTITEILWAALYISFLLVFTRISKLEGAGIAFFTAYFIYTVVIVIVGYKITSFHWNRGALKKIGLLILSVAFVFITSRALSTSLQIILNSVLLLSLLVYSYNQLNKLLGVNVFKYAVSKIRK